MGSAFVTASTFVHASRGDYALLFAQAYERGWRTVVIVTASQLAEICAICALEQGIRIAAIVDAVVGTMGLLLGLYSLATLLPGLGVSVRRLHDQGKSGLFLLILVVPCLGVIAILILMALEGTPGSNEYGEPPAS